MSQYRGSEQKDESKNFTFEDSKIIEKLLMSNKLTEKEKQALKHLRYSYNFLSD